MKSIYTAVLVAIMGVGLLMMGCDPPPEVTPEELVGNWTSECYPVEVDGLPYYELDTITYTTTTRDITQTFYYETDPPTMGGCVYALWEQTSLATYALVSQIDNDAGKSVTTIDYTFTAAGLGIVDVAPDPGNGTAISFNDQEVCGFTDWGFGVTHDIFGNTDCTPPAPGPGAVAMEVFQMLPDGDTINAGTADANWYDTVRETELYIDADPASAPLTRVVAP